MASRAAKVSWRLSFPPAISAFANLRRSAPPASEFGPLVPFAGASQSELVLMAAPRLAFGDVHFCFDVTAYRSSALKRAPSGIAHGVRPTAAL
jgi:hypothetical protein